jgi:hypothetical protein
VSEEDFEDFLLESSPQLLQVLEEARHEYTTKGGVTVNAYLSVERKNVGKFKLVLSPRAVKDLDRFTAAACTKVINAMKVLEDNPFPRGKLVKKIRERKQLTTGSGQISTESSTCLKAAQLLLFSEF